ncbi:MAG: hypothetical protein SPF30_02565 [Arcanobacterium sp.]|nr:hypothetical protein [Arcanobacterium sp.]
MRPGNDVVRLGNRVVCPGNDVVRLGNHVVCRGGKMVHLQEGDDERGALLAFRLGNSPDEAGSHGYPVHLP